MKKSGIRKKKDIALLVSVVIAVGLIAAVLIPIIYSGILSGKYREYVSRYTASMNISRRADSVSVVEDGEERPLPIDAASLIYTLLLDTGMGKPQTEIPEETAVEIRFADQARISFWETDIPEKSAKNDTGLLIKYQAFDGYEYIYDTDKLTLDSVVNTLK